MSNKTIFQEKNTRLNANNINLTSILETINNLPSAGSGGGTDGDKIVADFIANKLENFENDYLTTTHSSCIANKTKLKSVSLPSVVTIQSYAFNGCSVLESVSLTNVTTINANGFYSCPKLTNLFLRGSTVCTLSNTNALSSSLIASGTGYIYVPDELIDQYKSATNWSTYASQIRTLGSYIGGSIE